MNKETLTNIWNTKEWAIHSSGVYFVGRYGKYELNFNFTGYTESDVYALSDDFIRRLSTELVKLDQQAHEVIQKDNPDEDVSELELTDIMFDKSGINGAFSLGYDTGESPAGELYILVKFNEQFIPCPKLIYETY